jgi:hypothetical protein
MSAQPYGDETVAMPLVREAAAPPTIDSQLAAVPEKTRAMAAYNLTNHVDQRDVAPDVARAMRLLEADGFFLKQQAARQAAQAPTAEQPFGPVAGADDKRSWPKALTDSFAVWSLIASLFGFSAIGIILGAIHASNAHKQRQRASSVAAWGIGLGIASCVAWIILWAVIIAGMVAASRASYSSGYGY